MVAASLLALAQLLGAVSPSEAPVLAVFEVRDDRPVSERASAPTLLSMTTYLSALLTRSRVFRVVPSSELQRALQETKRESYEACYDERCQIEIGKAVAAALSLDVRVGRVGSSCVVTANMYDLREEASTQAATARGTCSEDTLTQLLEEVARQLVGPSVAGPVARADAAERGSPRVAPAADAPSGAAATRAAFAGTDAEWAAHLDQLRARVGPAQLPIYLRSGLSYPEWSRGYNAETESTGLEIAKWLFTGLSVVAFGVAAGDASARGSSGFWSASTAVAFVPAIASWSVDLSNIGDIPESL